MWEDGPTVIKNLMEIVSVLADDVMRHCHICLNNNELTLNPPMMLVNFLMKAYEQLMVSHDTWCFRGLLWGFCCSILAGSFISNWDGNRLTELSIKRMNFFINDSLTFAIYAGKSALKNFNFRQIAQVILTISLVLNWRQRSNESHNPWCIRLQIKWGLCHSDQSPQKIMNVGGSSMNMWSNKFFITPTTSSVSELWPLVGLRVLARMR